ncbi:MAG: SIMPL domain-containing protein [Smithella sp.]
MNDDSLGAAFIKGVLVCIGLALLGYFIAGGIVKLKALERIVTVKGLSEREVQSNVAIWPIKFSVADNDLNKIFFTIQQKNSIILEFLNKQGFQDKDISISAPAILDQQSDKAKFRYSGISTINVYSENVDLVRKTMASFVELGKQGIAISGGDYQSKPVFIFKKLNELKPVMIEEATKNARAVAEKFARDSNSKLGKIKSASQGEFSIEDRDSNTPYIKQVRVVSTVEYYLSD